MKTATLLVPILTLVVGSLGAAPFDDASALLQSRKYPEAAAAFAALPADAGEKGQAAYLHALSLLLAEKAEEAMAAADKVPADSPWALKSKFTKALAPHEGEKAQGGRGYLCCGGRAGIFAPTSG